MKVGIIGCGKIARVHVAALSSIPTAEVVGLCDSYLPAAGQLAERFGLKGVYRSVDDLFDEAHPEVVHVLTPPETHAAVALRALEAGAHVLVEKPMATSVAGAEAMAAAAKKKGLALCVDHNRLFDPVVERAKLLVNQGAIGEVVEVETYQGFNRSEGANSPDHWSLNSPAGVYYNLAVHPVYLQLFFLGKVGRLFVCGRSTGRFPSVFAEEIRVLLEGEKAQGYLCFSVDIQPHLNALHIYGTRGTLLLDLNTMTLLRRLPSRLPKLIAKSWTNVGEALQLVSSTTANGFSMLSGRLSLYPGITRVIHRFYESLTKGGAPPVTAEEGCEVVRLLEEVRLQAEGKDAPVANSRLQRVGT